METGQVDGSNSEANGDISATNNTAAVKNLKPPAYKIIILGESGVGRLQFE